ncbi:helix-turn-helix domain-containing protein [Streptomyces bambusae]
MSTTDRMLLAGLAEKADADGCNAFPSRRTLARIALCDVKTVQRRLATLLQQGLIALGDQEAARYIPAHARPRVYDLQIPAAWYGPERLARVNQDRTHRGLPPLTDETRAPLPPAVPRVQRSDKGKPLRPEPGGGGDCQSPPANPAESDGRGDSQSRGRGDCQSRQGGLRVPQPSPLTHPPTETPAAPAARSADDARRATTGSSARDTSGCAAPTTTHPAPTPDPAPQRPGPGSMPTHLAEAIRTVEAGWPSDLAALLPTHRPAVLRQAVLEALDHGRTPQQLVDRIRRRWRAHG